MSDTVELGPLVIQILDAANDWFDAGIEEQNVSGWIGGEWELSDSGVGEQKNVAAARKGDVILLVARGERADVIERLIATLPSKYAAVFQRAPSSPREERT